MLGAYLQEEFFMATNKWTVTANMKIIKPSLYTEEQKENIKRQAREIRDFREKISDHISPEHLKYNYLETQWHLLYLIDELTYILENGECAP